MHIDFYYTHVGVCTRVYNMCVQKCFEHKQNLCTKGDTSHRTSTKTSAMREFSV